MSRVEYKQLAHRFYYSGDLSESEAILLHRTVVGLDALELLGRCCNAELATSNDVALIGESLAQMFCEEGYSLALYTLFKAAGDKICRQDTEESTCWVADSAAMVLWSNLHSYEDRENFIVRSLCHTDEARTNMITYRTAFGRDGGCVRRHPAREVQSGWTERRG